MGNSSKIRHAMCPGVRIKQKHYILSLGVLLLSSEILKSKTSISITLLQISSQYNILPELPLFLPRDAQ